MPQITKEAKGFNKTKLATMGGACWECCDYEGIVEDMKSYINSLLTQSKEEASVDGYKKGYIDGQLSQTKGEK